MGDRVRQANHIMRLRIIRKSKKHKDKRERGIWASGQGSFFNEPRNRGQSDIIKSEFRRCYNVLPKRAATEAMGHRPTLILTTRLGVRPLGVRGDPLHAVAGQLLAVIRRRLGDGPANLLAEPQLRESGDGIDWYASADRRGPPLRRPRRDRAQPGARHGRRPSRRHPRPWRAARSARRPATKRA